MSLPEQISASDIEFIQQFLGMQNGYILDLPKKRFVDLVSRSTNRDLMSEEFATKGDSAANRFRVFWDKEHPRVVMKVLKELILIWSNDNANKVKAEEFCKIAKIHNTYIETEFHIEIPSINGTEQNESDEETFLMREYGKISLDGLDLDHFLEQSLSNRINEVHKIFQSRCYFATVIMIGGILEGLLLHAVDKHFNVLDSVKGVPRNQQNGTIKNIENWKLFELIEVSVELKLVRQNVSKFSHSLREFRNYIHPSLENKMQFSPDERTAKICMLVLKDVIDGLRKS